MHSAALPLRPANIVESDEFERLCANISQGLHALAQPLTIVRSAMAALAAPGIAALDQKHYLDLSVQHTERTCALFECLQELVIASQIDADCEPFDLRQAIGSVMEDRNAVLHASGMELRIEVPKMFPPVQGDANRTRQALSAALDCAAAISSPGDVVEMLATVRDGFVELNLQISRIRSRAMNSLQRLNLTLAEVNIRSQQGKYAYTEDPLRIFIALPLRDGHS